MKKGITDVVFLPDWEGDKFLSLAGQLGFDGVEFHVREEGGEITLNTTGTEVRMLVNRCKNFGVEIPSISTRLHNHYTLTSKHIAIREKGEYIALKMIEFAAEMGSTIIQVVPGVVNPDEAYEYAYERSQESLSRLAIEAAKAKITIGLENQINKFLPSPYEFTRFIDEINHPNVRAYLDVGNAVVTGYVEHWIPMLGDRIVEIHAKDYKQSSGEFLAPLDGDVNWHQVIQALHAVDFNGYIISTPPPSKYYTERLMERSYKDLTTILNHR